MKEKITLGKAGEIEKVVVDHEWENPITAERFEEVLDTAKEHLKAWGVVNSLAVNAAVLELQDHVKKLLTQPSQFLILAEDELDAVRFMSTMLSSVAPFFVCTETIESGILNTGRRSLPTEGLTHNNRRVPSSEKDQNYALLLSRFFSKKHLPAMLTTLGVFMSGRAGSMDVINGGILKSESRNEGEVGDVESRFLSRAILTLYHDWLAIVNPERCKKFEWKLPSLAIHDLTDLRKVSTFFFKALPAIREVNLAALVTPEQLFSLIPGEKRSTLFYLLETNQSIDLETELGDLILHIAANSPETGDYNLMSDEGPIGRPTPQDLKYWQCHTQNPVRALALAKACRQLDFVAHDLADLAGMIATFKWRTPVLAGGRGYSTEVVEFVGRDGKTGRGFNFLESGCALVDIPSDLIRHGESSTFNPLLRHFSVFIEDSDSENTAKAMNVSKHFHRAGFARSEKRLKLFAQWFGKPLFELEPRWL